MKKIITCIILVLMAGVLAVGGVSAHLTYRSLNQKVVAAYAKDGRMITHFPIYEDDEYLYLYSRSPIVEMVSYNEYYRRSVKYFELRMNKAEEEYALEEISASQYASAISDYENAKRYYHSARKMQFNGVMENFFSFYFPAVVLLGILLILNIKVKGRKNGSAPLY